MTDLNEALRQSMDSRLDRASFKGIGSLTDHEIVLVFEQQGVVFELRVYGEDGVIPMLRERT